MPESEILAFRIAELEQDQKNLREEIRTRYLDQYQIMNEYMPRSEQARQAAVRREWPLIVFGGLYMVLQLATLIVAIRGGR